VVVPDDLANDHLVICVLHDRFDGVPCGVAVTRSRRGYRHDGYSQMCLVVGVVIVVVVVVVVALVR
jgi:hypothetical protein